MECDEAENGLRMVDLQVRRVVELRLYDGTSFPTQGGTTRRLMIVEER